MMCETHLGSACEELFGVITQPLPIIIDTLDYSGKPRWAQWPAGPCEERLGLPQAGHS